MNKTIKQLADELCVSKTAIRKYMTEEFRAKHVQTNAENILVIDFDGCKKIAESVRKPQETNSKPITETTENKVTTILIDMLQKELDAKNKTIDELTAALKEAQSNVKAAQALHAGTMGKKMLEVPKKKIKWPWQKER